MIKLHVSLVILIVATNVAIAHCKHKSHKKVFFPIPHNKHIIIDDIQKKINWHPHHKKLSGKINTDNLDDKIHKILKEKNHKGGKTILQNDPMLHISVKYGDKGKIDIDENDRVKPIHKITKEDVPDWLDKKY